MSHLISVLSQFPDLPSLTGSIHFDSDALQKVSTDFGQIVYTKPLAVVKPKTVQDIVAMIRYAGKHKLKIMSRGMSHSAYGQCQCDGGVVFDMQSFNNILAADFAAPVPWMEAQAGATWDKLIKFSGVAGFAPPTTTDWQMLTMGGTLSTGGVGFMSYQYGLQTDHVLELDVVDGEGTLHTCSVTHKRELFDAVRAGLGQFGVITRARIDLSTMPEEMHVYQMFFTSLSQFAAAVQALMVQKHFECVHAFVVPNQAAAIKTRLSCAKDLGQLAHYYEQLANSGEKWLFFFELVKYDDADAALSVQKIASLQPVGGQVFSAIEAYYEYITKEPPLIAVEKMRGKTPHPELAVMQSETAFVPFMQQALADLSPEDMGEGPLLIIPVLAQHLTTPMFVHPQTEMFYFIGFLRNAFPGTVERVTQLTQQNLQLYRQSCALGGNRYPCDSIPEPATPAEWATHYGAELWQNMQTVKQRYDPHNVFVSNMNIFER